MARAFFSGQQTLTAFQTLFPFVEELKEFKTSFPDFNNLNIKEWNVENINTPCFGVLIPAAVFELTQIPAIQAEMKKLGIQPLKYEIDLFFEDKLNKIVNIAQYFRNKNNLEVAQKLEKFMELFKFQAQVWNRYYISESKCYHQNTCYDKKEHELKEESQSIQDILDDPTHKSDVVTEKMFCTKHMVRTPLEWDQLVEQAGVHSNWKQNLHYDKVLSCFGANEEESKEVVQLMKRDVEWLSKILNGFKIKGCLTDVVNLVMCIMKINPATFQHTEEKTVEMQIADTIRKFSRMLVIYLSKKDSEDLNFWIPNIFIHDAEVDDMLCWAILKVLNPNIVVTVQLPPDLIFKKLHPILESYGATIFTDPHSRNAKAVRHTFHDILNQ
jgi:hypothetical protein